MKTTPPRTTIADVEALIATQHRNVKTFLAGQPRKNAFLDGMNFCLFALGQGISSGAAAGLARVSQPTRNRPQRKAARA